MVRPLKPPSNIFTNNSATKTKTKVRIVSGILYKMCEHCHQVLRKNVPRGTMPLVQKIG